MNRNKIKAALLKYINATPELISLLYDLDLLPEQLQENSRDWGRMLQLSLWHRTNREDAKAK